MMAHLVSGEHHLLAGSLRALHLDVQDAASRLVAAVKVVAAVQVPDACDVPIGAEGPLRLVLGELLDGGADGLVELVIPFTLAGAPCYPCGPPLGNLVRRGPGWQRILRLLIQRRQLAGACH